MPNIKSQYIDGNSITIVHGSLPLSVTITKAQIQAFYQTTSGSAAVRKAAVIAWAKTQIQTALGAEHFPVAKLTIDLDPATGTPSVLQIDS